MPQGRDELVWVGHSTVLLEVDGMRLLTDPLLTPRVAHLRRHVVLAEEVLRSIDAVLVSHVHLDHLHVPSLRRLPSTTALVVPEGAGRLLGRRGFSDVRETQVGDTTRLGPLEIVTVPALHSDRRGPHSRVAAPPVGYLVQSSGRSVYFPGDTDLFPEMAGLAPVDVALLPIWGWGPSLGHGHLDPPRAAEAAAVLQARFVVPIHWGTYSPSIVRRRRPTWLGEPVDQFLAELSRIGLADRARVLAPGERLVLDGAAPPTVRGEHRTT
jgi:L-ascorbate metabolism protein UlaG (beta-lactamase superfamily)